MAEFVNPFSGVAPDRTLTDRELARAIRMALAAEEEAIHMYEAMADASDNALAAEIQLVPFPAREMIPVDQPESVERRRCPIR